MNRDIVY